jgi:hypothetical protein
MLSKQSTRTLRNLWRVGFFYAFTRHHPLLRVAELALTILRSIAQNEAGAQERIPKPPEKVERKPTIDKSGRKRKGYCLQDAMSLSGEGQKATYLDFRVSRYITAMLIYN